MSARAALLMGAALLLTACHPSIEPIAPADLPVLPVATLQSWIAQLAPRHAARYDLVWHLDRKQGSAAGRAVARIATPDTLRFDYRAPFGISGAAVVIRDSALWSRPEADATSLVSAAPLFWLALGAPQMPPADAQVFGREDHGRRVWRVVRQRESMDVVFEPGSPAKLRAQWRRDGELTGVCEVTLNERQLPDKAVVTFPATSSRFSFSVDAVDTLARHDRAIWSPPAR